MTISEVPLSLLAIVAAAMLSAGITWAIRPLLLNHALAKPNARSSHRIPTPQGAGIAVIAATLMVAGAILIGAIPASADAWLVNMPIALFSFSTGNVLRSSASAVGCSIAPKTPCSTRKAIMSVIECAMSPDRPIAADVRPKPTM